MLIDFHKAVKKYNLDLENILHVGAFTASELELYSKYPVKKIHWIEAQKKICDVLEGRLDPKINKVTCAVIADKDGRKVVFNYTNNVQSSSILELGEHANLYPNIEYCKSEPRIAKTIDTVLEDTNLGETIGLLSMDIQGAELLALKGATKTLPRISSIIMEVNTVEMYKGCALLSEVDEFLAEHGFGRVELGLFRGHPWGDALYIR